MHSVQTIRSYAFSLSKIQLESPFEANFKQLKMEKLLDNDYYRELLQEADEYKLMCTAIYYVPASLKTTSLISNKEYFYDWLLCNYGEFDFSETVDEEMMHAEMSLFLTTQTREEKAQIYLGFMTSYGMIEDLMCLNFEERYELVMDLGLVECLNE